MPTIPQAFVFAAIAALSGLANLVAAAHIRKLRRQLADAELASSGFHAALERVLSQAAIEIAHLRAALKLALARGEARRPLIVIGADTAVRSVRGFAEQGTELLGRVVAKRGGAA